MNEPIRIVTRIQAEKVLDIYLKLAVYVKLEHANAFRNIDIVKYMNDPKTNLSNEDLVKLLMAFENIYSNLICDERSGR